MKVEATLSFKHGVFTEFLRKNNMTIKELAAKANWDQSTLGNFIRFKTVPRYRGKVRHLVKVMRQMDPEITYKDIFARELPQAVQLFGPDKVNSAEIPAEKIISLSEIDRTGERLISNHHLEIENEAHKQSVGRFISKLCNKILTERQEKVLRLYYFDQLTYKEIGNKLNLTMEIVRQIHNKSIKYLQHLKRKGEISKEETHALFEDSEREVAQRRPAGMSAILPGSVP